MKRLRFLFVFLSVVMLTNCESKKQSLGTEGEKQIYYSTEGKKVLMRENLSIWACQVVLNGQP